jgi:hypothetical protein
MMSDEKAQLLALLSGPGHWCRDAEARDANGGAVRFDDGKAVAWDITGALCRMFGWQRACVLFEQVEKHLIGKPRAFSRSMTNPSIDAMRALQDFNDQPGMTFEMLRARLEAMPVWQGHAYSRSAL